MGNIFTIVQGFISRSSIHIHKYNDRESCTKQLLPLHAIYTVLCGSHDQKLAYNPHIQYKAGPDR